MSRIIRNFIKGVINESSAYEGSPPTPRGYKLSMDEGPPPISRGGSTSSGAAPSGAAPSGGASAGGAGGGAGGSTTNEQALIDYQKDAIQFIIAKQAEIANAADAIMDKVTGWDDSSFLADLYRQARDIDVYHGGFSDDGTTKNYTTLLLGIMTSTTVDPLFLNGIIDFGATAKQAGRKIRSELEESYQPGRRLKNRALIKESGASNFGRVLRSQIVNMASGGSTDFVTSALAGEAKALIKSVARNAEELKVLRSGGIHEDLGGMGITQYIRTNAKRAITSTALDDLYSGSAPVSWAADSIQDLTTLGVKGTGPGGRHTIEDLLAAKARRLPLDPQAETAAMGLQRQLQFIDSADDSVILNATRSNDVDDFVKAKASGASTTSGGGKFATAWGYAAQLLGGTGKLMAAVVTFVPITLVVFEELVRDPFSPHQVDFTTLAKLKRFAKRLRDQNVSPSEKIGGLDIFLADQYENNAQYDLVQRLPEAISEASGTDETDLQEFQGIVAFGPMGS